MILVRDAGANRSLEPIPEFALPLYRCWGRLLLDHPDLFDLRIVLHEERDESPPPRWRSGRRLAPQLGIALGEETIARLLGTTGDSRESSARVFERVLTTIVERLRGEFERTIWLDRVCGRISFERLVSEEHCPETRDALVRRRQRRSTIRENRNIIEEVRLHHLHDKWLPLDGGHELCKVLVDLCVAEELFTPLISHVSLHLGTSLSRALRTGPVSDDWYDWGVAVVRAGAAGELSEEEARGEVRDAILRGFTDMAEIDRWDEEKLTTVLRRACEHFGLAFDED